MRPLRRYVRSRLHRRIFVWFGISIALTTGIVWLLATPFRQAPPWTEDIRRIETFVAGRFADVWDMPAERERLTRVMAHDLAGKVALVDTRGTLVAGEVCEAPVHKVSVQRDAGTLGEVRLCRAHFFAHRTWIGGLVLVVAMACLWLASGAIARRVVRPLARVVRVARDIGDGKLASRVDPGRHCTDELGVLARAINDMAARIEKQLADQRELLAGVSHELRTPLGHMRVLIDMLHEKSVEPALVDELEREILEIDSLVGQLLASSRLAFDTVDRRELDGVDVAVRALERSGLDPALLEVEVDDARVPGDATLIARALANLLENARVHAGGVAGLRVTGDTEVLRFEVRDRGPGFAGDEAANVFVTFYRGAHRAGHSSLGLGLALVRRIAEAHGGQAWAANRPEGGAAVGFSVARAGAAISSMTSPGTSAGASSRRELAAQTQGEGEHEP